MKLAIIISIVLLFSRWADQSVLAAVVNDKPVALMNGVAHLGNGEIIENAVITFEQGKITLVADARLVRLDLTGYEVIDISEKHVYPVKDCKKRTTKKCLKVIVNARIKNLTEGQPANLAVLENEVIHPENSVMCIYDKGNRQPSALYVLTNHRLILQ